MTVRRKNHPAVACLLVFALPAALAGCSAASLVESAPFDMGMPAGAPARPAVAPQFPAVHDMPPPRADSTLSEDEQEKLERELMAVRDSQEGRPPAQNKKATTAKPSMTSPPAAIQPAGSGRNP